MQDYINIQIRQAPLNAIIKHERLNIQNDVLDFAILTEIDKDYLIYAIFIPSNRVNITHLSKEYETYTTIINFCNILDDIKVSPYTYNQTIIFDFINDKIVRVKVL